MTSIVNKNKLGTDAKAALLELFGVSAVIGACGNLFTYEFDEGKMNNKSYNSDAISSKIA